MAKEPDWVKVLKYLYDNDGRYRVAKATAGKGSKDDPRERHYESLKSNLKKKADTDSDNIQNVIEFLLNTNLIEQQKEKKRAFVRLTPKGFDVIHDRQLTKEQNTTNRILTILTVVLAFAAMVQAFVAVVTAKSSNKPTIFAGVIVFGGIFFIMLAAMQRYF